MISLFRNLYISDRFFIVQATAVALFILSYVMEWLFYGGVAVAAFGVVGLLTDIWILFRTKSFVSSTRTVPSILSLGEDHKVVIGLTNKSDRLLHIKLVDELPYQLEARDFKIEFTLDGGADKDLSYILSPRVRGKYAFGVLNVFVRTKFRMACKKERLLEPFEVAVYPSVIEMKKQELAALTHPAFTVGESKNQRLGKSYEFDRIKTYVEGNDTRNINWKATSKYRELMVNQFEDERAQPVYSIIDTGRTMKMPFNGLTLVDHAINATLAFSNIVLKKHDKAGLVTFSNEVSGMVPADRSTGQLRKIQHGLFSQRYDYHEADYEMLYINLRRRVPNRSLLFMYTNFDTLHAVERAMPALRSLNKTHLLVVLFFNNTELEKFRTTPADSVLEVYEHVIADKFIMDKDLIQKELNRNGIAAIKCDPNNLSTTAINKYLDFKRTRTF